MIKLFYKLGCFSMPLRHGLLGLLKYGSMTGYELHKIFSEQLYFFWQAQPSQIYRELNAMEKEGLLSSSVEIQKDRPNKKVYSITEAGRKELQQWLAQGHLEDAFSLRSPFLMNFFLSGDQPRENNLKSLKKFKELCEVSLAKLENSEASARNYGTEVGSEQQLYWGLTAIFGRYYLEMCLRWVQDASRLLEGWS